MITWIRQLEYSKKELIRVKSIQLFLKLFYLFSYRITQEFKTLKDKFKDISERFEGQVERVTDSNYFIKFIQSISL